MATSAASIPEHPPPYSYHESERDPDHISLRSAAPSYTSSVPPTYTASAGPSVRPSTRSNHLYSSLIPAGPVHSPPHYAFNVASWPSLSNHSQSRAYLNVAARRAQRDREDQVVRRVLTSATPRPVSRSTPPPELSPRPPEPRAINGREDALRNEGRAWDFFTAQISDWEHREASWRAFKARCELSRVGERSKKKGRKALRLGLGFYGRLG